MQYIFFPKTHNCFGYNMTHKTYLIILTYLYLFEKKENIEKLLQVNVVWL